MVPCLVLLLSLICHTALSGKPSSYQASGGADPYDPYPITRYVGSKLPLNVQSNGPQAMTHSKDRNNLPGRAIPKQSHFEPLFDDFPGPKTKQRIYYPGKGYVEMQVPVQQPDPYSDGKPKNYQSGSYDSARYNTGSYEPSKYPSGGSYDSSSDSYDAPAAPQRSYRPASYQAPAPQPSYSAQPAPDLRHEDDDSPFDYLAKQNSGRTSSSGGYQEASGSSYRPTPPAQNYGPAQPAYKPPPPKPSYQQPSYRPGGQGYDGGDDDSSEVGLQSYNPPLPSNPSGYVPGGSYPSAYPDTKSASTYSQSVRSYEDGQRGRSYDGHDHTFYDLAEQPGPSRPQPGSY